MHPILCGVYSRVATNQERRLLISVDLSLIPRPLPRFQCTLNTVDEAEESDLFADRHRGRQWRILKEQLLLNCMLLTCVSLSSHTTRGLLTSAHATRAGILFERGHHFFQHIWRCDFYLRAAITNRERRLIKRIWYSQFPCSLTACFKISPWPHFNLYVGLADTNMQCTSSWSWYEAYFK